MCISIQPCQRFLTWEADNRGGGGGVMERGTWGGGGGS